MRKAAGNTWIAGYVRRSRRDIACALGLGTLASACAALLMFASGYLISATATAGVTLFSIMVPVACVQLFGFGRPLARYCERLASHNWVLRSTSDMRLRLYRSIAARMGDPARVQAAGDYLGLLNDDIAHVQNLYLRVVFPTVVAYVLALGASVLFGVFAPAFGALMLLSLAITVVALPHAALLAARTLKERVKEIRTREYAKAYDDLAGKRDWVLAGRAPEVRSLHAATDGTMRECARKSRLTLRSLSLGSSLLLLALAVAVVLWAGGTFCSPDWQPNWIAAFTLGFFPLIEAFAVLPVTIADATEHRESVSRLDGYFSEGDGEKEDACTTVGQLGDAEGPAVEFKDVGYAYPSSRKRALDGMSLVIEHGESIAVLGRSGEGKTTFANMLAGSLKPDSGAVRLFGHDAASMEGHVHEFVGFIGQTPYLFNRTLRENLTMGVFEVSDDKLRSVLENVGLEEKLASLPKGLDTIVGETGVGFSGGEEHRIALARVLVADTPVVVVDEPFSALDPETERGLLDTLLAACEGRTLVVITHHLAQVERFDRVVFVEEGRITLDGSPEQLMIESPRFASLVDFDR